MIERVLETAALMLGASKSRGYRLEMICADFLAGAHLEGGNSDPLLFALGRLYSLPPDPQKMDFVRQIAEVQSVTFEDAELPNGLVPFNVQNIGRDVVVTYHRRRAADGVKRRDGWRFLTRAATSSRGYNRGSD